MANLTLSDQDTQDLLALVATEVDHGLARRNPQAYQQQVAGVIDTVLNRVASGEFPNSVREVANQRRQFSAITGPAGVMKYDNDVRNVPQSHIPSALQDVFSSHVAARQGGAPSTVQGALNYANPNFSSASNMGWVNKLDGPTLGAGNSVHVHGTTEGFTPVEAVLGTPPSPAPADSRPTALDAVNQFSGNEEPVTAAMAFNAAPEQTQSLADALTLNPGLMARFGAIPDTTAGLETSDTVSENIFAAPAQEEAPIAPIPADRNRGAASRIRMKNDGLLANLEEQGRQVAPQIAPASVPEFSGGGLPEIDFNPQLPPSLQAPIPDPLRDLQAANIPAPTVNQSTPDIAFNPQLPASLQTPLPRDVITDNFQDVVGAARINSQSSPIAYDPPTPSGLTPAPAPRLSRSLPSSYEDMINTPSLYETDNYTPTPPAINTSLAPTASDQNPYGDLNSVVPDSVLSAQAIVPPATPASPQSPIDLMPPTAPQAEAPSYGPFKQMLLDTGNRILERANVPQRMSDALGNTREAAQTFENAVRENMSRESTIDPYGRNLRERTEDRKNHVSILRRPRSGVRSLTGGGY